MTNHRFDPESVRKVAAYAVGGFACRLTAGRRDAVELSSLSERDRAAVMVLLRELAGILVPGQPGDLVDDSAHIIEIDDQEVLEVGPFEPVPEGVLRLERTMSRIR